MRSGKRERLKAWIERERPPSIGLAEWDLLARVELAPISESYLRKLVRECGLPLHPLVEGVRQGSLEDLEGSLNALARIYEEARTGQDQAMELRVRRLVIQAKDRARWRKKDEMVDWMLTWLENPGIFPAWAELRRRAIRARPNPPE